MQRLWMHIAVAVLLAGGALLAGTSLVDAHGRPDSCDYLRHDRSATSDGLCAYWCSIQGHDHSERNTAGTCRCCDSESLCEDN